MSTESEQLWGTLNARQRTYLRCLYDCDQATEAERQHQAARGFYDRTPASEWRWQMYGPVAPPSMLYEQLHSAGLVDPGTGSTWKALEERKLVETRATPDAFGVPLLEVKFTPLGRKLVRTATSEQRPTKLPKGTLRERQWAALARLYATGKDGIPSDTLLYDRGGFDYYQTIRRLTEYKPQPLVEDFNGEWIDGLFHRHELRYRITAYGRDYYEREWSRYRDLYPGVDAPAPRGSA